MMLLLLLFALTSFAAVAAKYLIDTGLLRGYPGADYLTPQEAALRPVYDGLDIKEKAVYSALYRGISKKEDIIPLPFEVKGSEYSKVYRILEKQEGEFFYLDSVYYTAKKVRDAKMAYKDSYDIDLKIGEFNSAVEKAVKGGSGIYGGYYIATYISNYIINNCRYVVGENHAWNQVKIGLDWYNIDVTWEDTDVEGEVRREYFLRPDKEFSRTHKPDDELFKPHVCLKDDWSFFKVSGRFAETLEQAENIVKDSLRSGNNTIDIEFSDLDTYEKFKYIMTTEDRVRSIIQESGAVFEGMISVKFRENIDEKCLTVIIEEEK